MKTQSRAEVVNLVSFTWSLRLLGLLIFVILLATAGVSDAQEAPAPNCPLLKQGNTRIDCTPAGVNDPPQPLFDTAFVRDQLKNFVEYDPTYAARVAGLTGKNKTYASADVVMQQCFGGGFLDSFSIFGPANYTFESATRWDQVAWKRGAGTIGGPGQFLDDFTRAWRDYAVNVPLGGMVDLFNGASSGTQAVAQDPYSPGGNRCAAGVCEFPQYESPDKPFGPNDRRQLGDVFQWQVGRQYVILVAWGKPDPDDAVDILRLWTTLTTVYKVPASHIAILYGNPAPPGIGPFGKLGGGTGLGDKGLRGVGVNGANSLADWKKALSGTFFTDNGKPYQKRPGDRLLIYNTGHGGHQNNVLGLARIIGTSVQYLIKIANGFRVSLSGDAYSDSSIADLGPNGDTDLLQLTFATGVPDGTQLLVNGSTIGTFGVDILPASEPIPVNAPPGAVSYQVTVDLTLLQTQNANDDVNVELDPYPGGSATLLNVDFSGGHQELLALSCGQIECPAY